MPTHFRNLERGGQEKPCICRPISWPFCRLASYLLNETVPTDLENKTLASAPHSLHWELCGITESPCARAKQRRQPWTTLWVDTWSHIIGSFRCCHYFYLNATDDFFSLSWSPLVDMSDAPENHDSIHTLPHITWMDVWLWFLQLLTHSVLVCTVATWLGGQ